jgi:SAM-dependent methyltransferase
MISRCLACNGELSEPYFSLNSLPLVDSFSTVQEVARATPRHDVSLKQCYSCRTIQIADPPDTSEIYRNYIYESTTSPDLIDHFAEYAKFVKAQSRGTQEEILEIGANDGLLISQLHKEGFTRFTAIDPAPQLMKIATPGVLKIQDFFGRGSLPHFPHLSYDKIIANNCFSHIPDLCEVLKLCKELLADTGLIFIEVQSTLRLLENLVFDYIYHEHIFYHTVTSFTRLAQMSGLTVFSVQAVQTKGGSLRFTLGHEGAHTPDGTVNYWIYRESLARVHDGESWSLMSRHIDGMRANLIAAIGHFRGELFGYGASATGTVLLSHMGLEDRIRYLVDDNPHRQNMFAPGSGVPVVPFEGKDHKGPCLVLAWRHAHLIIPKLQSRGIQYIVPLPVFYSRG